MEDRTNKQSWKEAKLKMRLKAWKDKKLMVDTTRSNKLRLQYIIREMDRMDKYYLKVTYGRGNTINGVEEIYNHGEYTNKKDLLFALSVFASKAEVVDYLENFAI